MSEPDVERARRIILRHGWNATCYQILNPGFQLWFSRACDAVVGYVEHLGTRIVGGAPVSPPDDLAAVAGEFEASARRSGSRTCYFAAEAPLEEVYRGDPRHASMLLGGQPCWNPRDWPRRIARHASLRAQIHRASNKGVTVTEWSADRAGDHPEVRQCLQDWLDTRGLPPLHFLIESDILSRLFDRRIFVARRAGRVVGFLTASPIPARNGWLVEQLVRGRGAVNGTSELLIDGAMHAMIEARSSYVSLGLAPLSVHVDGADYDSPLWLRALLRWLRGHGRRYYNFEGLEAFKAKFGPDRWEPIHAVVDEPRFTPSTLYAVAYAFARESPLRLLARAVRHAG